MPELVTIADILARHRDGGSPEDTIRAVYARIAAHADPALFITLRPEADARADAVRLEAEGQRDLPLWGVPFVVKDNIDVAGLPTTAACPAFAYMPTESAEVVRRLLAAGAIVIGKTNLDQFATGLVGVRPMACRAMRCGPISCPAARVQVRRRRWAPASCRSRSARTRPGRGASRRA